VRESAREFCLCLGAFANTCVCGEREREREGGREEGRERERAREPKNKRDLHAHTCI
jgi:hypothetical protein